MSNRTASGRTLAIGALVVAGLSGCAHHYLYQPAERELVSVQGLPAARYPVPPERPDGDVRVTTLGIHDLQASAGAPPLPTLHVRLVATNNGDATPWTLDTRQVFLDIAGEGSSPAVYVNAHVGTLPVVTIARGEQRTVDFFFPLPGGMHREDALPRFDVKWQVATGVRPVAGRTSFERFEAPPPHPHPHTAVVFGWGPFWWYDPFFPRVGVFVHPAPLVVIPRHPHHVYVTPRGRRAYR